jgi:nucleoside-diphosphate kinase
VDRTFVIVKPDGVARGLVGEILARLEAKQLRLVAAELRVIDRPSAERHYAEHQGKPFYDGLVEFITSGPALVAVVEGPEDTWRVVRQMIGATNPRDAAPGTIRGDLAIEVGQNLIHGSDSAESAAREIANFFSHLA